MPPLPSHPVLRQPRYWQLAAAKARLSGLLCAIALGMYLAFALAASFREDWMLADVLADANLGMFLALAVLAVCGVVALAYGHIANTRFDPLEEAFRRHDWKE